MSISDLKAAKARADYKRAGGVVTQCPPGAAETLDIARPTSRRSTQASGWKPGMIWALREKTRPQGIPSNSNFARATS